MIIKKKDRKCKQMWLDNIILDNLLKSSALYYNFNLIGLFLAGWGGIWDRYLSSDSNYLMV